MCWRVNGILHLPALVNARSTECVNHHHFEGHKQRYVVVEHQEAHAQQSEALTLFTSDFLCTALLKM